MRLLFSAFVALFVSMSLPVWAQEDASLAQAKAYVKVVADQAVTTIKQANQGQITQEKAKENFRTILNNSFDIPVIAKFTLGRYWRVATPAQQTEFTRLLQTVILNKYADRMLESSDNTVSVNAATAINDKDYKVDSTVVPKGKPPVNFVWRLRKGTGGFKVIDLAVEGISMSVTHRTDFANVIEREGGQVQALIDALKGKESAQNK